MILLLVSFIERLLSAIFLIAETLTGSRSQLSRVEEWEAESSEYARWQRSVQGIRVQHYQRVAVFWGRCNRAVNALERHCVLIYHCFPIVPRRDWATTTAANRILSPARLPSICYWADVKFTQFSGIFQGFAMISALPHIVAALG